ncbi:unnamed protein product [Arabidopsis halleri]
MGWPFITSFDQILFSENLIGEIFLYGDGDGSLARKRVAAASFHQP